MPTIPALARARRHLDKSAQNVTLVITGGLRQPADFAKALESEPAAIVPFEPHVFGTAANNGQMIAEIAPEHCAVEIFRHLAQLVFDSYFQKGLPHIPNLSQPACRFGETQVYYMDTIAGIGFVPTEYVDITSVMETKLRMLRCHKSQFAAISELAHRDLEQVTDIQSRFRGLAGGCTYAEGFCRLETWQRGLSRRLLP